MNCFEWYILGKLVTEEVQGTNPDLLNPNLLKSQFRFP